MEGVGLRARRRRGGVARRRGGFLAGCTTLYTEDLNHGQTIHGVLIINPFKTTIH